MKLIKKLFSIMTICFLLVLVVSCDVSHTHRYGDWAITTDPTATTEGVSTRECSCGEKEEFTLPVLTDTTFWTSETVDATCQVEGTVTYTSEYGTVTAKLAFAEHEYTYAITTDPTMDTEGAATATCNYGETKDVTVPALSDTEVWTLDSESTSTCAEQGSKVYKSIYGAVTVKLALAEHEYTYEITTDPTMDAEGAATATCKYGETKDVTVPALSDTEVWTLAETEEPTYVKGGKVTYTSIYGTIVVDTPRLIAPYENKTYYVTYFDSRASDGKYYFNELNAQSNYIGEGVTVNEEGKSVAASFPFSYDFTFEMVNGTTGEIVINYLDSSSKAKSYNGFIDAETGIIVILNVWNERAPFVYVPLTAKPEKDDFIAMFSASSWDKSIVIDYVNGDTALSIFVSNETVHFGVTIEDETTAALAAKDAYNSDYVYIKDAANKVLGHFVNDGTTLVVSDGLEGTYTTDTDTLVVSGYGKATYNGKTGTYELSEDADYTLGLYVDNAYYEVTITEDTTTFTKPMVTVTFATNGFEATDPVSLNKNIEYTLPVLGTNTETHVFKGWYLDADFETEAVTKITPSADMTVYAKWSEKVVINLVGVIGTDPSTILVGDGEILSNVLPNYTIDEENFKVFRGWYLEETFENLASLNYEISIDDSGIILYAKWDSLPAYYGTYYGTEIWNKTSGNSTSSKYTITIDENGNTTGYKKGIIISYDPETQVIQWKESLTSSTIKTYFYDSVSGTFVIPYSGNNMGYDFYIFSRDLSENYSDKNAKLIYDHFGIYAPKTPDATTINGYYARFVEVTSGNMLFFYNDHIYSNVTVTTADGNALTTMAEIKNAKTLIIKDNDTSILRLGTTANNFDSSSSSTTKILDTYLGTYISSTDENIVVIDGVGGITYGTKTGTYTVSTNSAYGFDVYLANSTEYYRLTLSENTYTIEKPMVTYHYVTGEGHPTVEDVEYNVNIKVTELPTVSHEGYAFKGWFTTDAYTTVVTNFTPVEETTLYAKWNEILTISVYYGETLIQSEEIESGSTFKPTRTALADGKLIVGFYLDAEFATLYDETVEITESINIYAKATTLGPDGVLSSAVNGGTEKVMQDKIYAWDLTQNENGTINLKSTNKGIGSSNSQLVVVFAKDSIVSFDYNVSSEGGSYDNLYVQIKRNGESKYTEDAKFGGQSGVTGTYLKTLNAGDTLAILYRKDSGSDRGNDEAIITNLTFTDGLPEATITYVYNDGTTANTTATGSYGGLLTEALLTAPENVRDENNFRFAGWYLDETLENVATTSYTVLSENLTLYAKWDTKVIVTFVVPEGATTVDDKSVWTDEAFEATSSMTGYIFRGWYTTADFDGEALDLTNGVTATTTLYAKFDETPAGSSFDKAQEVVIDSTNNKALIENVTTTDEFTIYYFKLVISVDGKYFFDTEDAKKVDGYGYANPKFALYESDMENLVTITSSYTNYFANLTSGTYYLAMHLAADPSKPIADANNCWGTVGEVIIETYLHDEVTEAVDMTLGTTVTIDTITSSNESYILTFTTTDEKEYQFDISSTVSSIAAVLYSDATLETEVFNSRYTTKYSKNVTLAANTTYYLKVSNNWSRSIGVVTIATTEFVVRDALAVKTFTGDHQFNCGWRSWTATTTFTFDNNGNVTISSSASDHDSDCNDYYIPSFTGSYTYTLEGTTLTLTKGSTEIVFTLDNADAPTKITVSSTNVVESSQGYFGVGTSFNLK